MVESRTREPLRRAAVPDASADAGRVARSRAALGRALGRVSGGWGCARGACSSSPTGPPRACCHGAWWTCCCSCCWRCSRGGCTSTASWTPATGCSACARRRSAWPSSATAAWAASASSARPRCCCSSGRRSARSPPGRGRPCCSSRWRWRAGRWSMPSSPSPTGGPRGWAGVQGASGRRRRCWPRRRWRAAAAVLLGAPGLAALALAAAAAWLFARYCLGRLPGPYRRHLWRARRAGRDTAARGVPGTLALAGLVQ